MFKKSLVLFAFLTISNLAFASTTILFDQFNINLGNTSIVNCELENRNIIDALKNIERNLTGDTESNLKSRLVYSSSDYGRYCDADVTSYNNQLKITQQTLSEHFSFNSKSIEKCQEEVDSLKNEPDVFYATISHALFSCRVFYYKIILK